MVFLKICSSKLYMTNLSIAILPCDTSERESEAASDLDRF